MFEFPLKSLEDLNTVILFKMGKNSVKRIKADSTRQEQTSLITNDGSTVKNQTSTDLDNLEERLRRLERTNSSGSSHVYKFVLFFIMGVVMTVILYPHASKALESLWYSHHSTDVDGVSNKGDVNTFMDVGEQQVESIRSDGVLGQSNMSGQSNTIDKEDLYTATAEQVDRVKPGKIDFKSDEKDHKAIETPPSETEEDLLIGETGYKEESTDADDERIEDNIHTERVELFNMEGNVGELPITFVDESGNEKSDMDQKGKKHETDKKTGSKNNTKGTRKNNDNKRVKKSVKSNGKADKKHTEKSDDIPDEIRNFQPTYQKNIHTKKIFADGRRIPPMELLPQKPNNSSVKVWLFEEFLSEQECDGLIRVHNKHVEDQSNLSPILCFDSISTLRKHLKSVGKQHVNVTPRDFTEGTTCVNASFSSKLKVWLKGNWSYSTAFYPGESRFASVFERRVQEAMGLKPENGGKFQITSYPLGIGYKSHTDCTEDSTDKRDRMATVLVYLDTVNEGGETDFPELGIWVRPRKARALVWNSMNEDGECEPLSIHQANKVIQGRKIILQRWYYYQSFYSLGKRPPEPPLPRREPGQPRVSCDEYEHGSCRWYDEWNFEHMLEYERQKYNLV